MHTDADFLAAVAANPSALTRLVYADWLDEQGDPRAELIRHEEQMREWPVFSDEYWQAKPRRLELRKQFDPAWVRAMGYGVSVPPLFRHGWPDDLRSRWRLIRELYELCTGHPMPDIDSHPLLVTQAETHLQDKLPESVAHFVAFARHVRPDAEWPIDGITDFAAQQDLEFIWLFEVAAYGDYLCVRRSDWHQPDPPVVHAPPIDGDYETGLEFDTPDAPPLPLSTLSEYVLSSVLTRYHGSSGEWGDRVPLETTRTRLEERFGPPVVVTFRSGVEEEVYETASVLVRLEEQDDGSGFLRVSVRSGGVEAVRDLLDFPPTDGGYRGGAFLPKALLESDTRQRMSCPEIRSETTSRCRIALGSDGPESDLVATERWARVAAEFGGQWGANVLYALHSRGSIKLPPDEQLRFLTLAAHGNANLAGLLGGNYLWGDGVKRDLDAASHWLHRAAEANDPHAYYLLGLVYHFGLGVRQDASAAIKWYEKAVALGVQVEETLPVLEELRAGQLPPPEAADDLFREISGREYAGPGTGKSRTAPQPRGHQQERIDKPDRQRKGRK